MPPKTLNSIVTRTDKALAGLEAETIALTNLALTDLYKQLERKLLAAYPSYTTDAQPGLLANQRALLLFDQLKDVLGTSTSPAFAAKIEKIYTDTLTTATGMGTTLADELMQLRGGDSFIKSTAQIPIETVVQAAQNAAKLVVNKSDAFKTEARFLITQGLAMGTGSRKIARQLRQRLGVARGRSEAIARTEVNRAQSEAAKANYKANGLEFFQSIATADGRLCPYCGERNGNVYRLEDASIPWHVNCRCFSAAWSPEWEEKGLAETKWVEDFRQEGLDILAQDGIKPNKGPTYFEKKAGLSSAPKPVWSPGKGYQVAAKTLLKESEAAKGQTDLAKAAAAKAEAEAAAAEAAKAETEAKAKAEATKAAAKKSKTAKKATTKRTAAFPKTIDGLEQVKTLGGSTGARLMRDPVTGNEYVMKKGANAGHLREEVYADRAYKALGVAVPKFKLYETADGPVKLAQYLPDLTPLSELSGQARTAAIKKAQKGFAADALLSNWDVVGLNYDNLMVDAKGKVYRIDNGGSLRYRAQGAAKRDAWNNYPDELWSMRDRSVNPQAAEVFEGLTTKDLTKQIKRLLDREDKLYKALPPELQDVVFERLRELNTTAQTIQTLTDDKFKPEYADGFAKHGMGIRAAGIVDRMPNRLQQSRSGEIRVVDETGKAFDHLRGDNSIIKDLKDYLAKAGGNYRTVEFWMGAQAGSSWSTNSLALKWYFANSRTVPLSEYFWMGGEDKARSKYEFISSKAGGQRSHDTSLQAFHAFNYELMRNVNFTNRNAATETIQLMRTENKEVMKNNNLSRGDQNVTMRRGVAESTSIFKPVTVYGSEMTVQHVPWHRVLGTYFQERMPELGGSAFLGDHENEFVVMLEGIPFDYLKSKKGPAPISEVLS